MGNCMKRRESVESLWKTLVSRTHMRTTQPNISNYILTDEDVIDMFEIFSNDGSTRQCRLVDDKYYIYVEHGPEGFCIRRAEKKQN